MATTKYPTDLMHLEEDAKAVSTYVRALTSEDTDPTEVKELMFRLGLRLMRIEQETKAVGKFVDALSEETAKI